MYYWGGAAPGSNKCFCGLQEKGCHKRGEACNCDADIVNGFDGGNIVHKDYLPIMELYFGDTGTVNDNKIGKYKVGELECEGDCKYLIVDISVTLSFSQGGVVSPTPNLHTVGTGFLSGLSFP